VSLQGTGILLEFLFHFLLLRRNLKGIPVPVEKTEGQLLTMLHLFRRQIAGQNNSRVQQMTSVVHYYTHLITFCYLCLDNLYLEEAELVDISHS